MKPEKHDLGIWAMALGYFLFYIPYSASAKVVSDGLLPGMTGPVPGFHLLPAVLVGTFLSFQLILYFTGWWRYARKIRLGPWRIPFAGSWFTFYSGVATAVIIASTTLAYTFHGISIVFALLLMRGGVLILAPVVDKLLGRKVSGYSWAALGMSFFALGLVLADQRSYVLSLAAVVNIGAYLAGYLVRLRFMTLYAKSDDRDLTNRYFAEEMIVASVALALIPIPFVLFGTGEAAAQLRQGYSSIFSSGLSWFEMSIGVFYTGLYIFGTRIYLDKRENSFCIPINRCTSLLSGIVAAFALTFIFGKNRIDDTQLISAGIMMVTLMMLGYPAFDAWRRLALKPVQQLYIFVCSGNTSRSPIAQAICRAEMAKMLGLSGAETAGLKIISAGLSARTGAPLDSLAAGVLREMGAPVPRHRASNLSARQVARAKAIWCMEQAQRAEILQKFPAASGKTWLLNPAEDIENPAGKPIAVMRKVAHQISASIRHQLREGDWRRGAGLDIA